MEEKLRAMSSKGPPGQKGAPATPWVLGMPKPTGKQLAGRGGHSVGMMASPWAQIHRVS